MSSFFINSFSSDVVSGSGKKWTSSLTLVLLCCRYPCGVAPSRWRCRWGPPCSSPSPPSQTRSVVFFYPLHLQSRRIIEIQSRRIIEILFWQILHHYPKSWYIKWLNSSLIQVGYITLVEHFVGREITGFFVIVPIFSLFFRPCYLP